MNLKNIKNKSENKYEFKNIENRNSYDEKIQINWSYENYKYKNALI